MLVTDLKAVGNKLYQFRKAEGLTQEKAAEKAGVSARTYADMERGLINIRIKTLLKICASFGITPDDLFTETPKLLSDRCADVMTALEAKGDRVQENVYDLLSVYLKTLDK